MSNIDVIAIPGSLRRGSYNRAALGAAAELAPEGMSIEILDLGDIPLYNADDEQDAGYPGPVASLREAVAAADALLIATPEYNGSVTGVLKNAIDWLSRGGADSPLRGKPTALLGAGGRFGTVKAQLHLREILLGRADVLASPQVMIDAAATRFDDALRLVEDRYRMQIAGLLEALAERVSNRR